jgi:hypothetical protein
MRGSRISHREGREMQARIAGERAGELAAERRDRRLEQDLDLALREHRGDVAGSGRLGRPARGIRTDLDRHRRRRKPGACERGPRSVAIRHEMSDVIEKYPVAER